MNIQVSSPDQRRESPSMGISGCHRYTATNSTREGRTAQNERQNSSLLLPTLMVAIQCTLVREGKQIYFT